jgi:hypothetical protein
VCATLSSWLTCSAIPSCCVVQSPSSAFTTPLVAAEAVCVWFVFGLCLTPFGPGELVCPKPSTSRLVGW